MPGVLDLLQAYLRQASSDGGYGPDRVVLAPGQIPGGLGTFGQPREAETWDRPAPYGADPGTDTLYHPPRQLPDYGGAFGGGMPQPSSAANDRLFGERNRQRDLGVEQYGGLPVYRAGWGGDSPLNQLMSPQAPEVPQPPSVPPEARPFLDAVASGESPAYNIRYDGGKGTPFDSFADHPRQLERITAGPYRGQKSDAAGRYQMISTTYDKVAKPLGLTDFSPASQDMAAWQLANDSYGNLTKGRDLLGDLQAGRHDDVARVLSSEWASIARNPQAFVRTLRGAYPPPGS